ncbi:MAG: hypothetical protein AAF664_25550, partial [Planctomycetota bacterium]
TKVPGERQFYEVYVVQFVNLSAMSLARRLRGYAASVPRLTKSQRMTCADADADAQGEGKANHRASESFCVC